MEKQDNGYETMTQRGTFEANGFTFTVKPVYLGEEDEYLEDVPYALYPRKKDEKEPTSKDLSHYAIMLFRNDVVDSDKTYTPGLFERFKRWFAKTFTKKYEYYSDNPSVLGLVKWIEKKVYYKGKPVRFYDLERKFGLTKSEIVKLFGYFQELSGF